MSIQQFRDAVYQTIGKRAAATLDLVDALTVAGHVASPVALSEEVPFQRRFSSVYDVLDYSDLDQATLAAVLYAQQPADCEMVAEYEVYAVDTTPNERPTAETLADRGLLKSQRDAPVRLGQKFSWLVRLVQRQTSWVAPWDVRRVPTTSTDTQTAVAQVQALDGCSDRLKVLVADSLYCNHLFLRVFLLVQTVCALVRLRRNQNLYEAPSAKAAGAKGAPRKHGPVFRLAQPARPADRTETFQLAWQTVRLSAWTGLHLRKLPALVGLALRVEFLKADGTPRYKLPLWLPKVDRTEHGGAAGLMPDVPVALCDRACLSLHEAASGPECQSQHPASQCRALDVAVRLGLLAVVAAARRGRHPAPRLVSTPGPGARPTADPGAGAAPGPVLSAPVGHTGTGAQTRRKRLRAPKRLPTAAPHPLSGGQEGAQAAQDSPKQGASRCVTASLDNCIPVKVRSERTARLRAARLQL